MFTNTHLLGSCSRTTLVAGLMLASLSGACASNSGSNGNYTADFAAATDEQRSAAVVTALGHVDMFSIGLIMLGTYTEGNASGCPTVESTGQLITLTGNDCTTPNGTIYRGQVRFDNALSSTSENLSVDPALPGVTTFESFTIEAPSVRSA